MSIQCGDGNVGANTHKNLALRLRQREILSSPLGWRKNHAWDLCCRLASDDKFQQKMKTGKYSEYAVGRTGPQLFAVLQAVAEWAKHCDPSLEKAATDDDNEDRRNALNRVIYSACSSLCIAPIIPKDLGVWADELTPSDVFGVLWLVRAITVRESSAAGGIGRFSFRAFQCVQPLLNLIHGKVSHYRLGGEDVPFSTPTSKKKKEDAPPTEATAIDANEDFLSLVT